MALAGQSRLDVRSSIGLPSCGNRQPKIPVTEVPGLNPASSSVGLIDGFVIVGLFSKYRFGGFPALLQESFSYLLNDKWTIQPTKFGCSSMQFNRK